MIDDLIGNEVEKMKLKCLRLKIRLLLVFAPNERIEQIGEWMANQIKEESMKGGK